MFQSFMGGDTREKFQQSFQKIQSDLEQMAVEAGGELPPETRRQYFREQMQKMSEEMAKEREASGAAAETRAIAADMVKSAESWRRERGDMDSKLMEGVQATLKDPQKAEWPAFDRFLRREKSLPRGRLSGESVNLFAVLDAAGLSKESIAKLSTLLEEYEVRLDEALKRRNDYLGQNEAKALRAIQEGDAKAMENLADRMIDLRNAVRAVNEESRTAIVAALSPEDRMKQEAVRASGLLSGGGGRLLRRPARRSGRRPAGEARRDHRQLREATERAADARAGGQAAARHRTRRRSPSGTVRQLDHLRDARGIAGCGQGRRQGRQRRPRRRRAARAVPCHASRGGGRRWRWKRRWKPSKPRRRQLIAPIVTHDGARPRE